MALTANAVRVLGALLEKERTTPDAYPLTTQALVAACNQKTARDPVLTLHLREVEEGLQQLRDRGLAQTIRGAGDRVPKHRQRFTDAARLGPRDAAVMAVLMLRGPQTPGELRTRTERYVDFPDVATVEATLQSLTERSPALALNRGRGPGQSQDRWVHTLGPDDEERRPRARVVASDAAGDVQSDVPSHADLLRRIEALEARVAALEAKGT
jgi:uncharacterized protein YceH (UPF0502 family)